MGNKKDSLGDRIKENYENRSKTYLTRRTPVIIRLDGKAFHTFTRHLKKPYDKVFHDTMNETLKYLCENIQGCVFGYTQSDEISLVLTDFANLNTDAWFDYSVQKMCSISASMATMAFNRNFNKYRAEYVNAVAAMQDFDIEKDYLVALQKCSDVGALFDARCFNVPEDEVVNTLIWRQQDATRNAVQMLGQTYFSHKELHKKSTAMIQEMLFQQRNINFNDMPVEFKRGVCCLRVDNPNGRTSWHIDTLCPIFTQDRNYIERFLVKTYK